MKARNCMTGALLFSLCLAGAACKKNDTGSGPDQIYLAGHAMEISGRYTPCYWKNGNRIDLTRKYDTDDGEAYSIAISGNDIHIAGISGVACYWKNGERTDLSTYTGEATSVFITK